MTHRSEGMMKNGGGCQVRVLLPPPTVSEKNTQQANDDDVAAKNPPQHEYVPTPVHVKSTSLHSIGGGGEVGLIEGI